MNSSSPFDPSDFFGEEWKFQKPEPPQPRFKPGNKVVCIKTSDWPGIERDFTGIPQYGHLYVVRSCNMDDAVCLVGIVGAPCLDCVGETAFDAKNFVTLSKYRAIQRNRIALEQAAREVKAFWRKASTQTKSKRSK